MLLKYRFLIFPYNIITLVIQVNKISTSIIKRDTGDQLRTPNVVVPDTNYVLENGYFGCFDKKKRVKRALGIKRFQFHSFQLNMSTEEAKRYFINLKIQKNNITEAFLEAGLRKKPSSKELMGLYDKYKELDKELEIVDVVIKGDKEERSTKYLHSFRWLKPFWRAFVDKLRLISLIDEYYWEGKNRERSKRKQFERRDKIHKLMKEADDAERILAKYFLKSFPYELYNYSSEQIYSTEKANITFV